MRTERRTHGEGRDSGEPGSGAGAPEVGQGHASAEERSSTTYIQGTLGQPERKGEGMRTMTAEQRQEAKTERWCRRQLAKDGFRLCKSRIRGWTNSDDQGG